ncbi:MAG TPA: ABC transporter ATP-binding protein [Lachnospiraceae bacterium]|nr:ABC transporter ATP-binding protein [Lachnospiraceae bacterium]
MDIITVDHIRKDFEYYKKKKGLSGSLKNLWHREKLMKHAVKDISFTVEQGEVVGLLGPNGAGKTTTLKMLSGILYPTSGSITVAGYIPWERRNEYKKSFSIVMGQKNQLWWDLPAIDTFILNKKLYEVEESVYQKMVSELTELLQVKDILEVQVRKLSLGERMKMEIMAALIHNPQILFLDEPTIGLDIVSQRNIRDFLKYYNEQRKTTIILTSHYTKDIEALCSRSIIINEGTVVYDGGLTEINDTIGAVKLLSIKTQDEMDISQVNRYGRVREFNGYTAVIEVEKSRINTYSRELLGNLTVEDFTVTDIPLEEGIEFFYRNGKVMP